MDGMAQVRAARRRARALQSQTYARRFGIRTRELHPDATQLDPLLNRRRMQFTSPDLERPLLNDTRRPHMKIKSLRILTVLTGVLLTAPPAVAHHFFPHASETPVSMVGTV